MFLHKERGLPSKASLIFLPRASTVGEYLPINYSFAQGHLLFVSFKLGKSKPVYATEMKILIKITFSSWKKCSPIQHCATGLSLCGDTSRSFLQQWAMNGVPYFWAAQCCPPQDWGRGFFGPCIYLIGCRLHHFNLKHWQNYHLLGWVPPGKLTAAPECHLQKRK